jgi:hypothetical protein
VAEIFRARALFMHVPSAAAPPAASGRPTRFGRRRERIGRANKRINAMITPEPRTPPRCYVFPEATSEYDKVGRTVYVLYVLTTGTNEHTYVEIAVAGQ